jgi:hypothetical protein
LLSRLSKIYLTSEAYRNIDALPEDWQNEIKTLVGFNQSKDELLSHDGVKDNWQMLARSYDQDDQITVERNWLYGVDSKKYALILQFFAKAQVPELSLMPGTSVNAELVFYKGVHPLRALMKNQISTGNFIEPAGYDSFHDVFQYISSITAENPFVEKFPVWVKGISFRKSKGLCYLVDKNGDTVQCASAALRDMQITAITGGRPCDMFLLANEIEFEPASIWMNNKYTML